MQNVVLIVHLLLALALIGVVLLQRNEGGGLGLGGGGAAMGRAPTTGLGKLTWVLGGAFVITSITLTIVAARNSGSGSVLDRVIDAPARIETPAVPDLGADSLLPPALDQTVPLVPQAAPAPDLSETAPAEAAPAADAAADPAADPATAPAAQTAPAADAAATDAPGTPAPAAGN